MRLSPSRRAELDRLIALPFAHRGLHGTGRVENSCAAFEAAIAVGHAIELDVRISLDGEAVVFHDDRLERLTEEEGPVAGRTAAELQAFRLSGSNETIPTLSEVLGLLTSRPPLLIEVKAPGRNAAAICRAVLRSLENHDGPVGVMSFNPQVAAWFARHAPSVLRGLVVTESGKRGWRGRLERHLAYWRAKPDFLAYDVRDLPAAFAAARRRGGVPILSWTVRSEKDRARAARHADQIIYERPSVS